MKNFIKKFTLLGIALIIIGGAFALPNVSVETAEATSVTVSGCTDIFATNYDINANKDDGSCTYPVEVVTSCDLKATTATTIANGGSVTLEWDTEGFETIKINGQTVSGANGSKTFTNVTADTIYTLEATNSTGDYCSKTVDVQCLPPVAKVCEPGDQNYSPKTDLTGSIYAEGKGRVVNSSDYCDYKVGLAAYEKFDNIIDNQKLFDSATGIVKAKSTLELAVSVPNCKYQIDLFYGHVLTSLDGQRYGERKLDYDHLNSNQPYCGVPVPVEECELDIHKTVDKQTANVGDEITYTINVKNIGDANCTGGGVKIYDEVDGNLAYKSHTLTNNLTAGYGNQPVYSSSDRTLRFNGNVLTPGESGSITWIGKVSERTQCGDFVVKNQAKTTAKELNNFNDWVYSNKVTTDIDNECVVVKPLPKCDSFKASPTSFEFGGGDTVLKWETTNATKVSISGIGDVDLDNTAGKVVSVATTQTFVLTATNSEGEDKSCVQKVTVLPKVVKPLPKCDSFKASPTSFEFGGGDVTLKWETTNATNVSISGIGDVNLDNTTGRVVSVPTTRTFVLTATNSEGTDNSCVQKVTVGEKEPVFTCGNNVNFSVSDSSIRRGEAVNLTWSTVNVDSLSISSINATALAGSQSVSPSSDTTYTLRAMNGTKTIDCPVSVNVSSGGGGGGGGSRSPRCDLDISDKSISRGEEITLRWDTSYAKEITIEDDRGNIIFTTDEYLSKDKEDFYDGSIKVKPTRDTQYTLTAERGSRDRECEVEVEVEDTIVVLEDRDQQPLVAGISLTQVPYTGFEAGPFMTSLFYALLVAWSLFITYLLVIRNRVAPAAIKTFMPSTDVTGNRESMKQAESRRPDVFAPSVMSKVVASQTTPTNLPTGIPVAGLDVMKFETADTQSNQATDTVVTAIENRAHAQKALLSSDAIRYFIASTEGSVEREEALDQVTAEAKKTFPLEDGWIVINQTRMQSLCETCVLPATEAAATPATVPTGTGSLAEAIVTGNVVAAYQMIGHRPMFALADAAADLDAVYRNRKGESAEVSQMLATETQNLSDEQISEMIAALTGALDGTYTDEASAVKMSIMKAVKVVA